MIRPAHTWPRHRWLTALADNTDPNGLIRPGKGGPGYDCMTLGWVEWVPAKTGERITSAGLDTLRRWDIQYGKIIVDGSVSNE